MIKMICVYAKNPIPNFGAAAVAATFVL